MLKTIAQVRERAAQRATLPDSLLLSKS